MKRLSLALLVVVIALLSLNVASAQGPGGGDRRPFGDREFMPVQTAMDIISEAIGLEPAEIFQMANEDGMTLSEIITAQGGDPVAIEAQIVAELTAQSEEALPEVVNNLLNNPLPKPGDRIGNGHPALDAVVTAIADATGMEARDVLDTAHDNDQTLGEVATAAGGDLTAIAAAAKADLTERINAGVEDGNIDPARAEEQLANLDTIIDEVLNTPLPELMQERRELRREVIALNVAVTDAAADALGVEPRELRRSLDEGDTLAGYITENGGDVDAVAAAAHVNAEEMIADAVADGRMTQEEADEMLANLDTAISDMLNREIQFRPGDGDGFFGADA